ncbi:class I SAM-dependent methyltransferase [Microbulbifer thermotolerans]|uniref:class I SAM-dependent methyltransferase n=1 Tax=Microbulbifer thermotolerans TaxID=252514 RepID=UPI0022489851|nr:class I SAM-dependent methyltransferase [Microbulbifer thermotolerans]MCX2831664.1 class I SAM-dependent methyltransferase [Microbulbifer thermotolerans]
MTRTERPRLLPDLADHCPLCRQPAAQFYHRDRSRDYLQCKRCALVFVPSEFHLPPEQERAYYDLHENSLQDQGYRRFLSRCANPLVAELRPGSEGLDFGCGPAPLLARMLEEARHRVALYDSYYMPNPAVMRKPYDFIVSTEVVEHLASPGAELQRLWGCLKPGGLLALMTKLVISPERFTTWHYIRDPTHICFFSAHTFRWLADWLSAELNFVASDVIFLRKKFPG